MSIYSHLYVSRFLPHAISENKNDKMNTAFFILPKSSNSFKIWQVPERARENLWQRPKCSWSWVIWSRGSGFPRCLMMTFWILRESQESRPVLVPTDLKWRTGITDHYPQRTAGKTKYTTSTRATGVTALTQKTIVYYS